MNIFGWLLTIFIKLQLILFLFCNYFRISSWIGGDLNSLTNMCKILVAYNRPPSLQLLSLVANPNQLLNPAHTETIPCEYMSLETIERWIIFGFAVCHQALANQTANDLGTLALQSGWVVPIFRDEVVYIHAYVQTFFESIKGYGKKVRLLT